MGPNPKMVHHMLGVVIAELDMARRHLNTTWSIPDGVPGGPQGQALGWKYYSIAIQDINVLRDSLVKDTTNG